MNIETARILVKISLFVLTLFICVFFYMTVYHFIKKTASLDASASDKFDELLKAQGKAGSMKLKLSKTGIMYRCGNYNLNPSWYITARCATGLVGALVGILALGANIFTFLGGFALGFFALGFIYKKLNESDNKEIVTDLYNTYSNLKIQLGCNIYILESLKYSYKMARNKRYKEALSELIFNISDKTIGYDEAVDVLKNRFDSEEVDKLCALLHNYTKYGASDSYTSDIMTEIQGVMSAAQIEEEQKIETKASLVTFGFFVLVIAMTGYGVMANFPAMGGLF